MNTTPVAVTSTLFSASSSLNRRQKYSPPIWARLASTTMPATATPQPPIHPTRGPNALVAQVNVVPQSGTARFSSR